MAATTFPPALAVPRRSLARTLAVYVKEAKYELINKTRIPVYAISTVVFPLMFYVLFGIVLGNAHDRKDNATYMLATMGCFGIIAVALFGFGVSLAMERGQGWLQVKRASPMPVSAYLLAKLFAAVVFSTVIMLCCFRWELPSAVCVCRSRPRLNWWAFWSRAQSRSAPWAWPWDTSPSRTQRRPWSTLFICRCRSAPDCGFPCLCCPMDCRRWRKYCRPITWRSWH